MTTPLVSVLIPSRGRPQRLMATIGSFFRTAPPSAFEILVRLDEDDHRSMNCKNDLECASNVRIFTGPPTLMKGRDLEPNPGFVQPKINGFNTELAAHAQALWVWIMNDDAFVRGTWEPELAGIDTCKTYVLAAHMYINSGYYRMATAFPIVPNGSWRECGKEQIPDPSDTGLTNLLRAHDYRCKELSGLTMVHLWRAAE